MWLIYHLKNCLISVDSDIKIYVADITTRGNGFPNLTSSLCQQLTGHLILCPNFTIDCRIFHLYVLHKLGHVLGLGHASSESVMAAISGRFDGL